MRLHGDLTTFGDLVLAELPCRNAGLEHMVELFESATFGLGKAKITPNRGDDTEGSKEEAAPARQTHVSFGGQKNGTALRVRQLGEQKRRLTFPANSKRTR
jgi:hypothetical protein